MKAFISIPIDGDFVIVRMRAEGDGILGDLIAEIRPGESFMGDDYDTLVSHGEGEIEIEMMN